MKLLGLTFLALLAACSGNGLGNADHCAAHDDYASCNADPSCYADGCPSCDAGSFEFLACYGKGGTDPHPHSCPAIACATKCSQHTDQASCDADTACESVICAGCDPTPAFFTCTEKGSGVECAEALGCPSGCSAFTELTGCEAAPSCHAVFEENPLADCASDAGGCLVFGRCDDNPVTCAPTPTPAHSCPEAPVCGTEYAPTYENGCETGCVRAWLCEQGT